MSNIKIFRSHVNIVCTDIDSAVAGNSLQQLKHKPLLVAELQAAMTMGIPVNLPREVSGTPVTVLESKPIRTNSCGEDAQLALDNLGDDTNAPPLPTGIIAVAENAESIATPLVSAFGKKESYENLKKLKSLQHGGREGIQQKEREAAEAAPHLRFTLTTGHSVHELSFSPGGKTVDVKEYTLRLPDSREPLSVEYSYGLWSDSAKDYQLRSATFRETPALETNWNHVSVFDNCILLGSASITSRLRMDRLTSLRVLSSSTSKRAPFVTSACILS